MKLLMLTEFFPESEKNISGGVETRAWHLCKNSSKNIIVITSRQAKQEKKQTIKFKKNTTTIYRVGKILPYSNDGYFIRRLLFQIAAYKKAQEIKKDWDHVHGMSFLMYNVAGLLRKLKGKKSSITYHECWIGEWKNYKKFPISIGGEISERLSNKFSHDKIISVSKFTQKKLKEKTGKNSTIVHNGIDLEEFKGFKGKKSGALIIGRITKDKNVGFALKNLEELNIKTSVIGDGPLRKELEKKNKKTNFLGRVSRKKLISELQKAEIYVNASTLEGFGIGVIEAAAAGTNYVISDIPPFREVTEGGKGGILFKPLNSEDFKKSLKELKQDRKTLDKLAKKYDWKILTKRFFEVINDRN